MEAVRTSEIYVNFYETARLILVALRTRGLTEIEQFQKYMDSYSSKMVPEIR
jgi:hypothetical protein